VTPKPKNPHAVDPVELQRTLLRFADEFSTRMVADVEKLRRGTEPLEPAEALRWKVTIVNETCAIATGPSALANLLDMSVFVTAARTALEEQWQPKVFGASAQGMLENCRHAETEIWQYAGKVLTPEQQAELRAAIEAWRQRNPLPENVRELGAQGYATQVAQATPADRAKPSSVFSLLALDPLSGLDPATREIAQTRLLAERALYVAQKMPMLLRWEVELLSLHATEVPAVAQMVTNATRFTASVERLARSAEELPGQISAEREEILRAIEAQERTLTPLVNEVRASLVEGAQMSTSLNTAITTFDALMKRFGVGEPKPARSPGTHAEAFRIQDYGQTAGQVEAMARQLTELLDALDQALGPTNLSRLSAHVGPVVLQAQRGGKELVDYAFWKGLLFVALVFVGALMHRVLAARLTARRT
jgi:hypothetical protein